MNDSSRRPFLLRSRLSIMMMLQYAIWGAWLPLLWSFLKGPRGFSESQIGDMFAVGAVGAILAPFVAGQIADRYFSTQKFLGISHLLGAALVWQLSWIEEYEMFLGFSLVYSIIYAPTLSLTNSLCFHHLTDRDKDFGKVRVWGTIGWIAVGIAIGQWLLSQHTPTGEGVTAEVIKAAQDAGIADAFRLSSLLGALMGLYCFTLPNTPPSAGQQKLAFYEALEEIRLAPLVTLFVLAVPVSCIHQFYFVHTAPFLSGYQAQAGEIVDWTKKIFGVGGGGLMTIGQMAEVLVLASIPFVAKKIHRKTFLAIGLMAYAARMALFAYAENLPGEPVVWLIIGVAMHGLCFGCFIFVAFMIVDEQTSPDVRASAQSLFNLVIVGIGIIVGSKIATELAARSTVDGKIDYTRLFEYPLWASLACLGFLMIFYPGKRTPIQRSPD